MFFGDMASSKNKMNFGEHPAHEIEVDNDMLRNFYKLRIPQYELFKAQDPKTGYFDVKFEIEGKYIYAHKFILAAVSETLNAWLSDRWTTSSSNDPIKIETYSFDVFYQLCCFLYSGDCSLTKENIFQFIDAAEFFGLQLLKNFCEKFMLEKVYSIFVNQNLFEVAEFSEKYYLFKLKTNVDFYICVNFITFINDEKFIHFKKSDVLYLCKLQNKPEYNSLFFEALYKWSKNQAELKSNESNNKKFDLEEAIKIEFQAFLPVLKLNCGDASMLIDFINNHIFLLSVSDLLKIYPNLDFKTEIFFELACRMAETQMKKRFKTSTDKFIKEAIKNELNEFLSKIKYFYLTFDFVAEFLVERSFLFSCKALLKILIESHRNSYDQEEKLITVMYKIAEKEVLQRQEKQPVENFNLAEAMIAELAEFFPFIKFYLMDKSFLMEFVVANGILTEEEAFDKNVVKVEIECAGKMLFGIFKDQIGIADNIHGKIESFSYDEMKKRFPQYKFIRPTTPSILSLASWTVWYLCLEWDGALSVKHRTAITQTDYLIAELKDFYENGYFCFENNRHASLSVYRL